MGALENASGRQPMNEEKDQKPEGHEQDFSEFAKHSRPPPAHTGAGDSGNSFLRGCGIAVGVVALVFFFVVGACFIGMSR